MTLYNWSKANEYLLKKQSDSIAERMISAQSVPGLTPTISPLGLQISISDVGTFLNYLYSLQLSTYSIESILKRYILGYIFDFNLHQLYLSRIRDDIIDVNKEWLGETIEYYKSIPIIMSASSNINATATQHGGILFNVGILEHSEAIVYAATILLNLDVFNGEKSVWERAVDSVRDCLISCIEGRIDAKERLLETSSDLLDLIISDRITDWSIYVSAHSHLLNYFILSHEIGHIVMQHSKHYSLLHPDSESKGIGKVWTQEYEADLFAGATMRFVEARAATDVTHVAFDVMATFCLLSFVMSQRSSIDWDIVNEKNQIGKYIPDTMLSYPEAITRISLLTNHLLGEDWWSNPNHKDKRWNLSSLSGAHNRLSRKLSEQSQCTEFYRTVYE